MTSTNRNRDGTTSSGLSRRQQHNAEKRRAANAIGLTDFSQKRGHVRALEEFKKRKKRKHLDTSIALRKYRKLMKREGFEAGTGASRKRHDNSDKIGDNGEEDGWNEKICETDSNDGDQEIVDSKLDHERLISGESDGNESDISDNNEEHEIDRQSQKKKRTKPKKMDPFHKSREKAKLAKQRAEEAALRRVANEKERQQKLKRRRQQTHLLQQRTKRGQPIMKHAINNLLYKLENQKKESGASASTRATNNQQYKTKKEDKPIQIRNNSMENPPARKKKKSRKFY